MNTLIFLIQWVVVKLCLFRYLHLFSKFDTFVIVIDLGRGDPEGFSGCSVTTLLNQLFHRIS